jgi:hypothetical protein
MSSLKELSERELIEQFKNDFGVSEKQIQLYENRQTDRNKVILFLGIGTTALAAIFIGPIVAIGSGLGTLVYYLH